MIVGIGIGTTFRVSGNSIDPDADDYVRRSGATDRQNISNFIKGLKGAGLWGSLVDGWMLTSSLNAGTGSTAYGLKGVSNGTLTNGPMWASDGITFATDASTGRDRYISCPWTGLYDIRANSTAVAVSDIGEIDTTANLQSGLLGANAVNGGYSGVNFIDSTNPGDCTISGPAEVGRANFCSITNQALPPGTFRMWGTQRLTNTKTDATAAGNKLYQDASLIASGSNNTQNSPDGRGSIANATTELIIGSLRSSASLAPVGKISFVGIWGDWTVSPSIIRSILKATILQGVLP